MYKKQSAVTMFIPLLLIGFLDFGSFLMGQGLDRTDPAAVANYALMLIRVGDVDGMLEIMAEDQKKDYLPFTPEKREQMQTQVAKNREKIADIMKVSEIREYTSAGANPGIAAKIRKKSGEVSVIILSKKDDLYYYDNFLNMTSKAYKNLKLIKKVR